MTNDERPLLDPLRAPLRDDLRATAARLERALLEGLDSGPATPMTINDWTAIRRRVEQIQAFDEV